MSAPSASWRGFVTLTLFASGFLSLMTGFVLYIVPEGSVARWLLWHILGLGKSQWEAAHTLSAFLFAVFALLHIANNWRSLIRHIVPGEGRNNRIPHILLALVLSLFIFFSAAFSIPPLTWVLDFGGWAKEAWVSARQYEPPFDRAEEQSLQSFCRRMYIDETAALSALARSGIVVKECGETLLDIARANGRTPMQVYEVIHPLQRPVGPLIKP